MTRCGTICSVILIWSFGSKSVAQVPVAPLTPLDQSVADTGPLSTSLRNLDPGLQQPAGFDDVYYVPGRNDLLMRIDGGMVAVFPRSTYRRTRQGTFPQIPPGTTFYIGIPTHLALGAPLPDDALPGAQFRVRNRVSTQVPQSERPHDAAEAPLRFDATTPLHGDMVARAADRNLPRDLLPHAAPFNGSTIANDPTYRARRLGALIQQAANASDDSSQTDTSAATSATQ